MQPISDLLIDRKRLKSQLTSWRAIAIISLFGALALNFGGIGGHKGKHVGSDYIAQISIEGIMVDDPARDEMMKEILEDKHAKAVLVRLDSPGGTTYGGEVIYLQLREIAKKKPVIGVMHTVCASACYMASLATDHVIAREGSLTGSIGVLLQSVEVSKLAEKLGISPISVKSGPYKDVPDIAQPFTEEQRKVVGEVVIDAYNQFLRKIVERRKLDEPQVRVLADGRVYTGAQAAKLKLIDGIGGNDEAIQWLAETHKINPKLMVRELEPEPEFENLLDKFGEFTGVKLFNRSGLGLDGLVSIWQH